MDEERFKIEHYKIQLRVGETELHGGRGTGRTQAMFEYAHELVHAGTSVSIIYRTMPIANEAKRRYRKFVDEEKPEPLFIALDTDLGGCARGTVLRDVD